MPISNLSTGNRPGICTSTTRPTAPYIGQQIYETNTNLQYVWSGSAWVQYGPNGATGPAGAQGLVGATGLTGAVGASVAGPAGPQGPVGSTGPAPNVVSVYSVSGNANVAGTGNASYHPSGIYSTGSNWLYGQMYLNGNNIGTSTSTTAGANQVYASGWFRSWGATGWYNQTYGGGIYMTDSAWLRTYNGKNFYCDAEIRVGGVLSANAGRARGSYGAISLGGNGITGGWDGIEFASPQTFMVQNDNYSGMYRNNNAWNWLFNYSTLEVGSDERFKREIEPLSLGLNFIEKLEPVSFLKLTEREDDAPEATEEGYYYGFTAQNVRAALDDCGEVRDVKIHNIGGPNMGLVACTEDAIYDRQYIGITEFISPIIKAIQELNEKLETLEASK